MKPVHSLFVIALIVAFFIPQARLAAQEAEEALKATTASNVEVEVEHLKSQVKPLTRAELEAEVKAWQDLVKEKVGELSAAEIDRTMVEGDALDKTTEAILKLTEERNALISRFDVVLRAFKTKGGEIEEYEQYLDGATAVSSEEAKDPSLLWTKAMGWLQSDQGGIKWGLNIIYFLATIIAFWILAVIVGRIVQRAVSKLEKTSELLRAFFVSSVRKLVFFIGFVVALGFLEVEITPFLAALGVVGFVVGFALQGTLSNFASGIMILVYRPYDIGDVISVAGVAGKVEAMTLVSTTVKTFDNQIVVVPNNSIWGDVITNVTGSDTRRVDMVFGIGYSDDIPKAQRILEEIVKSHDLVLDDPEPVVKLHELADSSVNFIVRPWSKTSDYWNVFWDVTRSVKDRFDAEGVSIPFPQRDVHFFQETGEKAPQPA